MDISDQVARHYWFHTIDLGNGILTPGLKSAEMMRQESEAMFGPINLRNKSLLDVGAWNGGFSVEAARRGAARIAALDHATWNNPELQGRETFDLVAEATNNKFDAIDIDLDQSGLSLKSLGRFDVVLFAGVFYHLIDPIAATRELAALTREVLVVETHVENIGDGRPAMVFYPGAELSNDRSNWWGPNVACVVSLLKQFGFPKVDVSNGSNNSRKIFHAYRA